jgi:hypothetical protein
MDVLRFSSCVMTHEAWHAPPPPLPDAGVVVVHKPPLPAGPFNPHLSVLLIEQPRLRAHQPAAQLAQRRKVGLAHRQAQGGLPLARRLEALLQAWGSEG